MGGGGGGGEGWRGVLNRYDFAYTRRDIGNQAAKVVPGIVKGATNEINNIAQQRINQIISEGGKEIERVSPPYQKQLNKLNNEILK